MSFKVAVKCCWPCLIDFPAIVDLLFVILKIGRFNEITVIPTIELA